MVLVVVGVPSAVGMEVSAFLLGGGTACQHEFVDAVQHQHVEVNVQIERAAETLDQRDR